MSEQHERPLASILARAGQESITRQGVTASRAEFLADMLWDYVLEGVIQLPDGTKLTAAPRDWIATAKWLYAQLAGPTPSTRKAAAPPVPAPNRHERRAAAHR